MNRHILRTKVLYVVSAFVLAIFIAYLILFAYNYSIMGDVLGVLIVAVVDIVFFSWYLLPENNVYRTFSKMVLIFVSLSLLVVAVADVMKNFHLIAIAGIIFSTVILHRLSVNKQIRYGSIVLFEIVMFALSLYIIKNWLGYCLTLSFIFVLNFYILLRMLKISIREIPQLLEELIIQPISKASNYQKVLIILIVTVILIPKVAGIPLSERAIIAMIALVESLLLTLFLGMRLRPCGIDIFRFGIVSLARSSISELRKGLRMLRTNSLGVGGGLMRALRIVMSIYLVVTSGINVVAAVLILLAVYSVLYLTYLILRLDVFTFTLILTIVTVSIMLSIFILFFYVFAFLTTNPQYTLELAAQDPLTLFVIVIILLTILIHTPLICSINSKST